MAKGGRQPGAGRPKGSITKSTADALEMRKRLIQRVSERLDPLLDSQFDLATGIHEAQEVDGKIVRVYKRAPDGAAGRYLLDQSVGRATETVKVTEDITLKIDI